ncbi:hypothetical protein Leryth_003107 [Lithospermum erythrorhizon]|uniref:Transporter n=1 Tax=Lithospermum erythrorhizon TaxID=34254 RepID=A0AAV3PNB6_LITER|nr:hypothetical protein Leryth_003107 [Lithospermum erythrorhizon]
MEGSSDNPNGKTEEHPLQEHQHASRKSKGGIITMPFIIANEAFEKVASYGLLPNMILYLIKSYNMSIAKGTNVIFLWSAATNFTPIVGAFLADSYLGRFLTIGLGSICTLLGMILLWLTAMISEARPPPCNFLAPPCQSASPSQYLMLFSSFALMSIGAGGVRAGSLAFGADQLDNKKNPRNEIILERFFNWYYASAAVAVLIALTAIVYIQEHLGWKIGFGVPAILMFLSALMFYLASSFYVKKNPTRSLFTSFAQVIMVSYKNRHFDYPTRSFNSYHYMKGSDYLVPTEKLRFLNKACIIKDPVDISPDGVAKNPWNLCTIEQVEELKALIKVIPIWSTGIMVSININQNSFPTILAGSMDRHVTPNFQIPAGSFGMFIMITLAIWLALYDRVILPLASRIKGRPVRLGVKERMGLGIFFSCIAMIVSGIVEHVRRRKAIAQGFGNNPQGVIDMSAMWLIPQHTLNGLAEALNALGQTEFYYSEFPRSMSSIAASLFGLGMAVALLLASLIVTIVEHATKGEGRESWLSDNINKGHYDKYYWLLAVMTFVNLLYYLVCSWKYGSCEKKRINNGVELEEKGSENKNQDHLGQF